MITEDYCSFEVAKLLKEKGFNEACNRVYKGPNLKYTNLPVSPLMSLGELVGFHPRQLYVTNNELGDIVYTAPTHQMAMKWLRKNHNIFITIIPQEIKVGVDTLCYGIYRITEDLYQPLYNGKINNLVDSYEECVEAALKYSLENLI